MNAKWHNTKEYTVKHMNYVFSRLENLGEIKELNVVLMWCKRRLTQVVGNIQKDDSLKKIEKCLEQGILVSSFLNALEVIKDKKHFNASIPKK